MSFMEILLVVPSFAFLMLLLAYRSARPKQTFSIVDAFMVFFCLQYGPHCLIPYGELSQASYGWVKDSTIIYHWLAMTIAYAGITIGLFWGAAVAPSAFQPLSVTRISVVSRDASRISFAVVIYLILFVLLSVAIDYHGFFGRISLSLEYIFNGSAYTYEEIRRVLFGDSLSTKLMASTRYSVTAAAIALVGASVLLGGIGRAQGLLLIGALFIVGALQLSKLIYVYFAMLLVLLVLYKRHVFEKRPLSISRFFAYVGALVAGFFLILLLYMVQYRDGLDQGLVDVLELSRNTVYRIFLSSSDALYLWYQTFPEEVPYTGLSNIGLFSLIFGTEFLDPTVLVPQLYAPDSLTSYQPGYIASAYASFGVIGVLLNSIIVGSLVTWWELLKNRLDSPTLQLAYMALMSLNMYWYTSAQFHTALLMGGGLLVPLVFLLLNRFVSRK